MAKTCTRRGLKMIKARINSPGSLPIVVYFNFNLEDVANVGEFVLVLRQPFAWWNQQRMPKWRETAFTSYDLWNCKVWSCSVQRFRRKWCTRNHIIWPWPKVTQNFAQYPRHHVTYAPAKFDVAHPMVKEKMHLQENTLFDLLNVAQYPRHHVTYAPAKFETATSQG